MEPENPLPCSQETTTVPCPEPDESSPQTHTHTHAVFLSDILGQKLLLPKRTFPFRFSSDFTSKTLYAFLFLDLIALIMFGESRSVNYKVSHYAIFSSLPFLSLC
jgi:hypothetical protein